MKKFLIPVLLAATAVVPAVAQERDGHGGGGNRGAPAAAPQQRAPAPQAPAQAPRGNWQGGGYAWHGYAGGAPRAPQAQPPAQAQGNWNHGFVGGQAARPVFAPPVNPSPQAYQQDRHGQPNGQQPIARNDQHFDHGGAQRDWHQGNHDQGQWTRSGDHGQWNHGDDHGQWNHGDDHGQWTRSGDHGQWNREWRHDQRYNWQAYRDYNRDFFHAGAYYNPYGYGYGYQAFGVGIYLDAPFYGTDYWINDPYDYRLPEAYGDTRWVRYYNDVILVDIDTGEVLDVIHNFFW